MKKLILLATLFALCSAQLKAQNVDQSAQIAQLTEEVNTLKTKSTTWDKITKALPKISGYAQVRYEFKGGDASTSTFQLRRVRVSFDGNISPKIDYKLQAELTSFKLVDAYFSYKPLDALNVRAGQFKLPFSIENTDYGPTKIELIDYPMALTYLVGYHEAIGEDVIKANGRDLGAKIYGKFANGIVAYDLGVFNGRGLNAKDNNKSKDVVGRLNIRPIKGLLLSGSYMWGEYGSSYLKRERWGAGVCYDYGNWMARSEYIGGNTGEQTSEGVYVTAGYRFCKNWMAVARYDTFCENTEFRPETSTTTYTVGINWRPVKHFLMQANYAYEDMVLGQGSRNIFQLQVSAIF